MPSAWIATTAYPEWVEAFRETGWEVEAFTPPDLSGSNWAIDVWLAQWSRVATYSKSWAVAAGAEYGQELWARNADLGTIVAPVNFAHKALVSGTSNSLRNWSDYALVSPLKGKTQSLPAGANVIPLIVMDLFPGDFTSMATHNIH